ncbi:MAG TPA: acyl-CoA reductase [Verrucomicrobiae bacterium]|jgi:hypothetical protein
MELPGYFLADLPPEAELSPAMIAEACQALKRNREKHLASRSTTDIVKILAEIAVEWRQPENKFRKLALEFGPAATGFSRAVLERGLDKFFAQLTPENFQALLTQEFGETQRLDAFAANPLEGNPERQAMAVGPEFLVHIAAGNLPNPALMSLTLGLLTRSAQFMKCASGASFIPRLFAHSIYEADRKLGACLELAEWRGGNTALEDALFADANCLTATGSDETLTAIRSRLPPKARFLGYGQRVSFGYVAREVLRNDGIAEVVSRVADDVVAWDQNGCLSPHCFYVEERGEVESDQFAVLLAAELMRREQAEPRGQISVEASAAIASRRNIYEALLAHRGDIKIWSSQASTAWTVVFEHQVRFHFSPLNRFVFTKPVPDLTAVFAGIDDLHGKVSTVGIAAPPEKMKILAGQFARWGATRICPLGQMQNPPLTWRHDGRPALGDLITWADMEA